MDVLVPDIGDFDDVPVIEIHVSPGDEVSKEDPLVTLESDKATMDVPAPADGTVEEVLVAINDKVSEGTPILRLDAAAGEAGSEDDDSPSELPRPEETSSTSDDSAGEPSRSSGESSTSAPAPEGKRVAVIGAGIGGYSAAFRAADLGLEVTLIERHERLGGVCLNVGCIPSKALLHAARVIAEAEEAEGFGISFGEPEISVDPLRGWKDEVVGKLTGGLAGLAKKRKVEVVTGEARFAGPNAIEVDGREIEFDHCVIAAGSRSAMLPDLPDDPRIVDSTGALELPEIPERLLVVGGGIIGLEMATVYDALGTKVSVVELTPDLIPGCDRDLVKPLQKRIEGRYEAIMLATGVAGVEAGDDGITVSFEGENAPDPQTYDRVLIAVGRRANGDLLDLEASGVEVGERGVIAVDERRRTNVPHIYAIGDIVGEPMLAHKAGHEGRVAAEVIAGHDVVFEPRSIPAVAYTDPEIAWTGLTETDAKEQGVEYETASFPWAASGRALASARPDGLTKVLVDPASRRILGAGIAGINAGELIAEAAHAIEMGADAEDVGLTIHPHPTLSESVGFAAEMVEGTITDLYAPRRKG